MRPIERNLARTPRTSAIVAVKKVTGLEIARFLIKDRRKSAASPSLITVAADAASSVTTQRTVRKILRENAGSVSAKVTSLEIVPRRINSIHRARRLPVMKRTGALRLTDERSVTSRYICNLR